MITTGRLHNLALDIQLERGQPTLEGFTEILENQKEKDFIPVKVLGRKITFTTVDKIIERLKTVCRQDQKIVVAYSNIHSFNLSFHLPWFNDFQNKADIVYCDGFGILKAAEYCLGIKLPKKYRVAGGSELVPRIIDLHDELSYFLLGDSTAILEGALKNLRKNKPGIKIDGYHGYFDKSDPKVSDLVIEKINQFKPNVIILGMSAPIQEEWLYKHMHRIDANVFIPCGAVIARMAGAVPDCPTFISELGLEWLYRLLREPKRLTARYLVGNLAFALQVLLAKNIKTH